MHPGVRVADPGVLAGLDEDEDELARRDGSRRPADLGVERDRHGDGPDAADREVIGKGRHDGVGALPRVGRVARVGGGRVRGLGRVGRVAVVVSVSHSRLGRPRSAAGSRCVVGGSNCGGRSCAVIPPSTISV